MNGESEVERSGPPQRSWDFLQRFSAAGLRKQPQGGWLAIQPWLNRYGEEVGALRRQLEEVQKAWGQGFPEFGDDPCDHNWDEFRPLRLSREEDWSDWLAYLIGTSCIKTSCAAAFGRKLFSAPDNFSGTVKVQREVPVGGRDRRCDLIIQWGDSGSGETPAATNVEVKIGDQHFEKTHETARLAEKEMKGINSWRHIILLPTADVTAWAEVQANVPENERKSVEVVTWNAIARDLRQALLIEGEGRLWKAYAFAFCGAVEQKLLGLPWRGSKRPASMVLLRQQIEILKGV